MTKEEIEKLAMEFSERHAWLGESHGRGFQAGFQKCLELLKERMPSDIEISREYGRKGMVRDFILERLEGEK